MPAITLGYPQIEQQIRVIRRRRNSFTVQHAIYLWGGMMLLGVALLVVLAIRVERLTFTIAFWAALGSIVVSLATAVRLVWQRWIGSDATPRWIDRVAQLDDRLSTLVAHHAHPPPTRLLGTLISQLFALRYRWEPTALVPRRIPRSIYFFAAAAAALISTAFIERPAAQPQRFPHASTVVSPHPPAPDDVAAGRLVRVDGGGSTSGNEPRLEGASVDGGIDPKAMHAAASGQAARGIRGSNRLDRMHAAAGGASGGTDDPNATDDAPGNGRSAAQQAMPDRLQDLIRQAFEKPPLGATDQPRGEGDKQLADGKSETAREREGGTGDQRGEKGRSEGSGSGREVNQQRGQPSANPQEQRETTQRGDRGSGGTGAGGNGTGGIYGQEGKPVDGEHVNKTFQLKLVLLGHSTRATMEPQKGQRGTVSDIGVGAGGPQTDRPLNPQQRDDEPLVRGEVPPEHEAMIKRIFSHAE